MTKPKLTRAAGKTLAVDALYIIAGNIICALALVIFIVPNQIPLGGFSGIAVIINHLLPMVPFGVANLALNLPLLVISFVVLGWKFVSKTVFAVIGFSLFSDLFAALITFTYTDDLLLATLFGGLTMGFGAALVLSRGATGGGTEALGWLIRRRWPHYSLGRVIFVFSCLVIAGGALSFGDINAALYAAIMLFVHTRVVDAVLYGVNNGKVLYIFSSQAEIIAKAVIEQLGRSASILPAKGAFTGDQQSMLMCVVRRNEVGNLRRIIKEHDPKSFMVIAEAQEVYGYGWKKE
ncbi:MAG: YitT family protein [Oscillospiraceae bacterium]|nr:YitT family protein [Oscillospiraceae bacterium]